MLLKRLSDLSRPPGAPFLSARAVSSLYSISYQTAHRLLAELAYEGKVIRRAAAGTYRPGAAPRPLVGVQLLFHERSRRPDSFGAYLLRSLRDRLKRDRIECKVIYYSDEALPRIAKDQFPVLWESPLVLANCVAVGRPALLLNDQPPAGIDSLLIDSVSVDDFSGGAYAGQLLARQMLTSTKPGPTVIVAGPLDDRRSVARVAGCRSVLPDTIVVSAGGWYLQDGLRVANRVLQSGPSGIFCCNDRLAEAVMYRAAARTSPWIPAIVGFDDAPVAEALELTTIAIPWTELVGSALSVVRRRLEGDSGTASRQIVLPRPVVRWPNG